MGEAKRRKIADLESGLRAIQREGQGIWECVVTHVEAIPSIRHVAETDDPEATRTLACMLAYLDGMYAAPPDKPLLCLTCDNQLTRAQPCVAVAVLSPHIDAPTAGIGSGICSQCFSSKPQTALKAAVVAAYRVFMPDARAITIGAAGHD